MPTADVLIFFAEYFFIYIRFDNFKFYFPEFQQLRNKYAKYTLCRVLITVTQWEFNSQ
jgi:hypothetical protein